MSNSNSTNPKPWHQVYQGGEECRFFRALSRNPDYEWRSVGAIAKESKLSEERVEKIISKYLKDGVVIQHSSDASKFQYWERAKPKAATKSIAETNKDKRIKEAGSPSP